MGDTKINLSSTEDLSKVIYSRKVQDKKQWSDIFNIGIDKKTKRPKRRPKMSDRDFQSTITKFTDIVYKTVASQCPDCKGVGLIRQMKVDGTPFKNMS